MFGRIRRLGCPVIATAAPTSLSIRRIAVMSTATSSAQSMRQQLDDLDALLQRMLALPINQLDDPPPNVPPRPDGALKTAAAARVEAATPPPAPPLPASAPSPPRMRLLTDSSP